MIEIVHNGREVADAIQRVFDAVPRLVVTAEARIRDSMRRGLDEHFEQLGLGGSVITDDGFPVLWEPITDWTQHVRAQAIEEGRAAAGVEPWGPVLELTGGMRTAVTGGGTLTSVFGDHGVLTYVPAGEDHKITAHEEGRPTKEGRDMPVRRMLFWSRDLTHDVVSDLDAGLDQAIREAGFV